MFHNSLSLGHIKKIFQLRSVVFYDEWAWSKTHAKLLLQVCLDASQPPTWCNFDYYQTLEDGPHYKPRFIICDLMQPGQSGRHEAGKVAHLPTVSSMVFSIGLGRHSGQYRMVADHVLSLLLCVATIIELVYLVILRRNSPWDTIVPYVFDPS